MQIDLSHPDFQAAIPIMKEIEAAGFEAYFVGGAVRDAILGLPIHDVDIASSAYPQEIKQIFPKTVDTGIQHGTVMVLRHGQGYEVTTFRTESGYQDFRRPDHVTFVRSLEEDLKRRDFTVNALAVRHDGTVIDLFGGLADLTSQTLRAVGDPHARFHEDALRMMRAVRFESQLGFHVAPATQAAIQANAPLLAKISVERVAAEFTRLMLGQWRNAGLATFLATALSAHVPVLAAHPAAMQRLAALPATPIEEPAVAWTLVAALTQAPVRQLMTAWKQANALADVTQRATALLPVLPIPDPWQLYQAGEAAVRVAVAAAQYLTPAVSQAGVTAAYAALPIHTKHELAITGATLMQHGFTPGPKLGQMLGHLEQAVVMGDLPNTPAALLAAAQG
ncbi:CCA tRNA nucleotidyltransferase [Lacticaseibacillus daqingensis]|uniref:CCA tRNA nucleotidyltransferase n=1 Tax=Lacticaseibacillus daqingensis TaxID=2486014 RepID=UPI000F7780DE|nr:CCA tRNA nucleotidyltransferase [Lacticaseibacillus daqingensis]